MVGGGGVGAVGDGSVVKTTLITVFALNAAASYRSVFSVRSDHIICRGGRGLGGATSSTCAALKMLGYVRRVTSHCVVLKRMHNSVMSVGRCAGASLHGLTRFGFRSSGRCLGIHSCCTIVGGYGCTLTGVSAALTRGGRHMVVSRCTTLLNVHT